MNDLKKELILNKRISIFLIILSIITIGLYSSYALFEKKETYNDVVRITTATELPAKLVDAISTLKAKIGISEDELQGIDPNTGNTCSICSEYRYTGPTVKNYIKLKNKSKSGDIQEEIWRIIGIFKQTTTTGQKEEYIKIVRNEMLPADYLPTTYKIGNNSYTIKASGINVYWNRLTGTNSDTNNWATSGLQYYLNTGQDETIGITNKGYMSYLSEDIKSLLVDTKYYLGTYVYNKDSAVLAYKHERDVESCVENKGITSSSSSFPVSGCNVWNNNAATWTGKVALMYPSDFGYTTDKQYWETTKIKDYDEEVKDTSWVHTTLSENATQSWAVSPSSYTSYTASYINSDAGNGFYLNSLVTNSMGMRPVLSLSSKTKILEDGDGSESNPYVLSI